MSDTWPRSEPTADEMIRYAAGRALWLDAVGMRLAGDADKRPQHIAAIAEKIGLHDTVALLKVLQEVAPDRADAAAADIWLAAEAGDSYGERLWAWASDAGLDADAITAEGRGDTPHER